LRRAAWNEERLNPISGDILRLGGEAPQTKTSARRIYRVFVFERLWAPWTWTQHGRTRERSFRRGWIAERVVKERRMRLSEGFT
jgi:hypothetical protein